MFRNLPKLILIGLISIISIGINPQFALANSLGSESIALSSPAVGQTSVTYSLVVSNQSSGLIRCVAVRITDTLGSNSLPAGMDLSSTTLDGTSNFVPSPAAWTVSASNPTGIITLTNAAGETPIGGTNRTLILDNIANGTVDNSTNYAEITSYSDAGCTTVVDNDGVALFIFTTGVLVTSTVAETLNFSLTPSCSLGVLSEITTKTCTLDMHASSNHSTGYSISYSTPDTLHESSNLDSVTAIGVVAAPSTPGTKQFGMNLVINTVPLVGSDPVGGSGLVSAPYNSTNNFALTTAGGILATTATSSDDTFYIVSLIANIAPNMVAGSYIANQTYTIVANP